jgi:hypothetical protein
MITELENRKIQLNSDVLCAKILSLSKEIHSVEIINNKGRLVDGSYCKNAINLTPHKKEMFHMSTKLQESMKKEYDDEFGKVNYSYIAREKISMLSFTMGEDTLIVTIKSTNNVPATANDIISLIY